MTLLTNFSARYLHYISNALVYLLEQPKKKQKMPRNKYHLDGSEQSMIPVIKTGAYLLLDGSKRSNINALEEFSAGTGISDITLFSIDKNILKRRASLDKSPLTSKAYVELVLFITSMGSASIEEIREKFSAYYSPKTLKTYLDSLIKRGILEINQGSYTSTFNYSDLTNEKVVAIEAKVKDWKSGIKQAMRYQEYADYSYLAIYEDHIQNCLVNIDIFERLGLGLIGVSDQGISIHLRAKKSEYQQIENKILAFERFLSVFDSRYDAFKVGNNIRG